ncbi:MAG: AAA domain-containing protein [Clostridiales bacterium]|nr:AAA domain-containing protein [Clostridiales bacterium]
MFNSEYKQLIVDLRMCQRDNKKLPYDKAVAMTERLSYYQEKFGVFQATEMPVKNLMGAAYAGVDTDWGYVEEQMSTLQSIFNSGMDFGTLTEYSDFEAERRLFADFADKLDSILTPQAIAALGQTVEYFDPDVFNLNNSKVEFVLEKLNDCIRNMDMIENWCHFRNLLSRLEALEVLPYINRAIDQNIEPQNIVPAFEKQFYYQWIDSIIAKAPVLAAFNRISQDKAVDTFAEKDAEQFEINKAKIRADLSAKRPALDMIAPGSALAILLREGEKKRKQKSIRSLLIETGELVQRIKPCFLMSPLSVSTFLATDAVHFDVVIFDEASQIFPQDAIGAIYRAKQLIVVGDSKQMPPSNFFNATIESEDRDEETGDVTDFESILDLCSASMPQLRLRWHYRSRYEQLIAFSNKNFYDGELITFPSSKVDAPGIGVDYYHADGVFDRKTHTNRKEAEYVVDLIHQNIEKYPNRSLGVVAFSVAQQDLIDKLLSKRRQSTPEKEFLFKRIEKESFFIKNLETVQGDERDTIIFSVAYGIDAQGRLLHNFGPLNRVGGERRLNVAVTRAKCNVQLVSSMHHTDIDLTRTSAEGAKPLREYLDFAENGTIALERSIEVNRFEQFDSDFELEVCDFLRSNGFSVDTQVGCSGFRIDLGLKLPNSSDYVLAIECDGATYHSSKNARDRDRLRQEILERMGWKFYRIWSTDWFRNKAVEKQRLLEAAEEAVQSPAHTAKHTDSKEKVALFEETAVDTHVAFPAYQAADIEKLVSNFFRGISKAL